MNHRSNFVIAGLLAALVLSACSGGSNTNSTESTASTDTVLYSFVGGKTDGNNPYGSLTLGNDGNFYGMTSDGGANAHGTVFKVTSTGIESLVYSFAGGTTDGASPTSSLTLGSDGNFYGMTNLGGTGGNGTIFKVTPAGVESVLYSFGAGTTDGGTPYGKLTLGNDGNFYGMTNLGGASHNGTIFTITPAGVESVLYFFSGGPSDGGKPAGSLVLGNDGNFYGMTSDGGTSGNGTIFKVTPAGALTLLHSLAGGTTDGADPYGNLIVGNDGNFYGMTRGGGTSDNGTVFKITPAGVETVLYSFAGGTADGTDPYGSLVVGNDGNFYGMTSQGGATGNGILFNLTPGGVETVLYSFSGSPADGANPSGNLILGNDGHFYGMTNSGGAGNNGTIFRY